jgi:hypothetical protein
VQGAGQFVFSSGSSVAINNSVLLSGGCAVDVNASVTFGEAVTFPQQRVTCDRAQPVSLR